MSIYINQNKSSSLYRPEIDGLRAFAVVAVIINHFNKDILPGGYLGVDIFFVISGFVITSSLYQRPSKNFRDFISGFYERRIKRLVPALSFFVLITSILICLFNPNPYFSLRTGLTSLFGLSNLYLIRNSTNYFAQSSELNVFTHTWSLGVEEQFYLFFPFLIWFSGFGRQTKNGARNLFLIVGILTITSLIGFLYLYEKNQSAAYFLMPTRFWEMATGCLIFIGFKKWKSIELFLGKFPPLLVLTLIIGVMFLPNSFATTSTIAVIVFTSILIASLNNKTRAYKIFTHPKVIYIGLISYSLYLWHWGILSISRWTIGIHWWSLPFQVLLILGISIASHKYIERPFRKSNWLSNGWKTFVVGGGVIVTLSGGIITLERTVQDQLYMGKKIKTAYPKLINGEKCLKNLSKKTSCFFIENSREQTLWVLGDSQARSIALTAEKVAKSLEMNLKLYSAPGNPFPPLSIKNRNINDFNLVEKELYRQIKVGDVILLSMRMPYYFGGTFNPNAPSVDSQENYFDEWISLLLNLSKVTQNKGVKVIMQTPTPEWEKEYKKNLCTKNEWFNISQKRNCQISSKFLIGKEIGVYNHLFEKLNQLSTSSDNLYLFDTFKIVCPLSTCSFIINGNEVYLDSNHLSHGWARDFLAPEISKFIKTITD